jgi:hypothetical protein
LPSDLMYLKKEALMTCDLWSLIKRSFLSFMQANYMKTSQIRLASI